MIFLPVVNIQREYILQRIFIRPRFSIEFLSNEANVVNIVFKSRLNDFLKMVKANSNVIVALSNIS